MSPSLGLLEEWSLPNRRPYLDGVPIGNLLEPLADELRPRAQSRNLGFLVSVTAWNPLVVAADRRLVLALMRAVTICAIDETEAGCLSWRAYPSRDDVSVTFEFSAAARFRGAACAQSDTWQRIMSNAEETIRAMGGDVSVAEDDEGTRLQFCLPQWVSLSSFGLREAPEALAA